MGVNFFRNQDNLVRKQSYEIAFFCGWELSRSSVALLSVVGRWNKARYKRGKREGNLNKKHIFSFGVLWSFLGLSLVRPWFLARENLGRYKGSES